LPPSNAGLGLLLVKHSGTGRSTWISSGTEVVVSHCLAVWRHDESAYRDQLTSFVTGKNQSVGIAGRFDED
jgi:hypothetical protein